NWMPGKAGNRTGSRCVSEDRQKSALILCIAHAIHARSAARGITAAGAPRPERSKSDRTRLHSSFGDQHTPLAYADGFRREGQLRLSFDVASAFASSTRAPRRIFARP